MTKSNLEKKGFICLTYPKLQSIERRQELKAEPGSRNWGRSVEEGCLLACFPLLLGYFLRQTRTTFPGLALSRRAGPYYISHYSVKCSTDLPTGSLMELFSLLMLPSSPKCLDLSQIHKNQPVHHRSNEAYIFCNVFLYVDWCHKRSFCCCCWFVCFGLPFEIILLLSVPGWLGAYSVD